MRHFKAVIIPVLIVGVYAVVFAYMWLLFLIEQLGG